MRVMFIATRDPRKRYRFLHDPLQETDLDVGVFEDTGALLPSILRGVSKLRQRPRVDVVMLTGGDIRNFIWFLLVSLLTRARIVIRFGGDPVGVRDSALKTFRARRKWLHYLRSLLGKTLSRVMLRRCDGVILVSSYLLDNLRAEIGQRVQTLVLAPTIPDRCANPGGKVRDENSKQINLLTVTNLNYREKADGVIAIIDALGQLVRSNADKYRIRYDVVGGGHQLEYLQGHLARLEPVPGVDIQLRGKLPEVNDYYRCADIFVYCSTLDGYPLVLCEAQSFGLPIVANRWGAFPDMLSEEEDALLFDSGSIAELGAALRRLFDDAGLRRKMGQAARANFTRSNSIEACGNRLKQFLHSLN